MDAGFALRSIVDDSGAVGSVFSHPARIAASVRSAAAVRRPFQDVIVLPFPLL
jgi:hypothetical protein